MPLAQGKKDGELYIGAFLLSEPEAGSDATSQRTIAEDKGDHYIVEWSKELDHEWQFCFGLLGHGADRCFERQQGHQYIYC